MKQPVEDWKKCPAGVLLTALPQAAVLWVFVFAVEGDVQAKTWRVPVAVATIKAAVEDSATHGDTVLVAPGVYDPASGEIFPIFIKNGVILAGENGPDVTVIDANTTGPVLHCSDLDSTTAVTGCTVTGGSALDGGGIHCADSYLEIRGNIIAGNRATGPTGSGGGIHCYRGSPRIIDNRIVGNTASYFGGGIYCHYASALIDGNVVSGNTSLYGGGVFNDHSSPVICNNRVAGNYAIQTGAGLDCYMSSSPTIAGNVIVGNRAGTNGAGIACCYDCAPTITGNTIVCNTGIYGGAVRTLGSSSPIVEGNIIVDNVDGLYLVDDSGPITANQNRIYCNTSRTGGYEVINNSSHNIDLSNNFWWLTDAFSIASLIAGGSNFMPFLTTPPDGTPGEPTAVVSVTAMADNSYTQPLTGGVSTGDTLYIQLSGVGWNDSFVEPALAIISSQKDPLGIAVALMETGPASSLYRGVAYVTDDSRDTDDQIGVNPDDAIVIWAHVDSTKGDTVAVGTTGVEAAREDRKDVSPGSFCLHQNCPNPFNGDTEIRYQIPLTTFAALRIFNMTGQLVRTILENSQEAGMYVVSWDGRDAAGNEVSSGIYFSCLKAGNFTGTRKMILLR